MKKRRITQVLVICMVVVAIFCLVSWVYYQPEQPNMALFCAMAAGVVEVNFLIALFFARKNFPD